MFNMPVQRIEIIRAFERKIIYTPEAFQDKEWSELERFVRRWLESLEDPQQRLPASLAIYIERCASCQGTDEQNGKVAWSPSKTVECLQGFLMFTLNLIYSPWKAEYHTISTFSGFFKTHIELNMCANVCYRLFELIGYEKVHLHLQLINSTPPSRDHLLDMAVDFFIASVEFEIQQNILESVSRFGVSPLEVYRDRRSCIGSHLDSVNRLKRASMTMNRMLAAQDYEDGELSCLRGEEGNKGAKLAFEKNSEHPDHNWSDHRDLSALKKINRITQDEYYNPMTRSKSEGLFDSRITSDARILSSKQRTMTDEESDELAEMLKNLNPEQLNDSAFREKFLPAKVYQTVDNDPRKRDIINKRQSGEFESQYVEVLPPGNSHNRMHPASEQNYLFSDKITRNNVHVEDEHVFLDDNLSYYNKSRFMNLREVDTERFGGMHTEPLFKRSTDAMETDEKLHVHTEPIRVGIDVRAGSASYYQSSKPPSSQRSSDVRWAVERKVSDIAGFDEGVQWQCLRCTFANQPNTEMCALCQTAKHLL